MAGVFIGLILSFLFFFILTRVVWVRVIKENDLRIQLHMPLLALHLKSDSKKEKTNLKDKKQEIKLSTRAYFRVIAGTLARTERCEVLVKRIILPCKANAFDGFTLVRPFGYQGLIYAAIAYLKTKAKHLALEDNAIISSPDVTEAQYYVTVKLRLYELICALLAYKRGINEEKKRARETRYVGE